MRANIYLGQAKIVEKELLLAQRKYERAKSAAEYSSNMRFSAKVSKTPDMTAHEKQMIRYAEAQDNVRIAYTHRNDVFNQIDETLVKLQGEHAEEILRWYYLDGMKMTAIAKKLHFTRQFVYKLRDRAMDELDVLLGNDPNAVIDWTKSDDDQDVLNVVGKGEISQTNQAI